MEQLNSRATAWKTYGVWSLWVGIAFFSVYPTCNWLTSLRESAYPLYTDWELDLPFIPEFIWAYLSMYVLFLAPPFFLNSGQLKPLGIQLVSATIISGGIFLLIPSQLGFERVIPADAFYAVLYSQMFSIDLPHNMVPSLHVVFSSLILFALSKGVQHTWLKGIWLTWLCLICLSTVFVHQHHLLDIISGLFVSGLVYMVIERKPHV